MTGLVSAFLRIFGAALLIYACCGLNIVFGAIGASIFYVRSIFVDRDLKFLLTCDEIGGQDDQELKTRIAETKEELENLNLLIRLWVMSMIPVVGPFLAIARAQ